ncbi:MAG: pilus assembly protein [Alphaproteobacteria bacterium]|nr:pilus assembly protein [Alphaproteobacteria bacterium]
MKRFFNRIRGDTKGGAAIEFGFTAPFLIMTIVGVMEFSMILFVNSLLEGSLREAARTAMTGVVPVGMKREEAIVAKIDSSMLGLLTIDASNITTLAYASFTEVGQPEPYVDDNPANGKYDAGESYTDVNGDGVWSADMGTPGAGNQCQVVVYRVQTEWPLMLGLLASSIGQEVALSATTAVRNEPYGVNPC